jgi:hypothetical protein
MVIDFLDNVAKGILFGAESKTRDFFGVAGYIIPERAKAFPGLYNLDHGTDFISRAFRGEVGAQDYVIEENIDDLDALDNAAASFLDYIVRGLVPNLLSNSGLAPALLGKAKALETQPEIRSADDVAMGEASIKFLDTTENNLNTGLYYNLSQALSDYAEYATLLKGLAQSGGSADSDTLKNIRTRYSILGSSIGRSIADVINLSLAAASDNTAYLNFLRDQVIEIIQSHAGSTGILQSPTLREFIVAMGLPYDIDRTYVNEQVELDYLARLQALAQEAAQISSIPYYPGTSPGAIVFKAVSAASLQNEVVESAVYDAIDAALADCYNIADTSR